jgi:cobalamin biosynthesis protein CobT
MADNSPLEQFKQVLTGTSRAIAHDPEIELAFTADAPVQAGKNFRVPMPGRSLPPEQIAEARGFAATTMTKSSAPPTCDAARLSRPAACGPAGRRHRSPTGCSAA